MTGRIARQAARMTQRTPRRGIGGQGTGVRQGDEPLVDSDSTGNAALCGAGVLRASMDRWERHTASRTSAAVIRNCCWHRAMAASGRASLGVGKPRARYRCDDAHPGWACAAGWLLAGIGASVRRLRAWRSSAHGTPSIREPPRHVLHPGRQSAMLSGGGAGPCQPLSRTKPNTRRQLVRVGRWWGGVSGSLEQPSNVFHPFPNSPQCLVADGALQQAAILRFSIHSDHAKKLHQSHNVDAKDSAPSWFRMQATERRH